MPCCLSIYNEFLRVFPYTRSTPDSELHGHSIIKHTTGSYTDLLSGKKIAYFIHGIFINLKDMNFLQAIDILLDCKSGIKFKTNG